MGLLENIAKAAIRNNVLDTLRKNCPAGLAPVLEQLLADKEAVNGIQDWVASCFRNPDGITAEALLALPLPAAAKELLADHPELPAYLVSTALAKLKH